MTRRWKGVLVLAMVVTVLGAACGGKGGSPSSGAGGGQSSSSGGSGGHGYGYGGGGGSTSGTTSGGGGASALTLQQTNSLKFVPAKLSAKSGATITVKNVTTSIPHTFTVQGQSIDITNRPGQSQKVKIDLKAGTYPFICKFHVSQGMRGTLTVT